MCFGRQDLVVNRMGPFLIVRTHGIIQDARGPLGFEMSLSSGSFSYVSVN